MRQAAPATNCSSTHASTYTRLSMQQEQQETKQRRSEKKKRGKIRPAVTPRKEGADPASRHTSLATSPSTPRPHRRPLALPAAAAHHAAKASVTCVASAKWLCQATIDHASPPHGQAPPVYRGVPSPCALPQHCRRTAAALRRNAPPGHLVPDPRRRAALGEEKGRGRER